MSWLGLRDWNSRLQRATGRTTFLVLTIGAVSVAAQGPPKPASGPSSLVLDVTAKTCDLAVTIPAAPAGVQPSNRIRAQLVLNDELYGPRRVTPTVVHITIPRGEDSYIAVAWTGVGPYVTEEPKRFKCREPDYRLATASTVVQFALADLAAEQKGYFEGLWRAVHEAAVRVDAAVLTREPLPLKPLYEQLAYFVQAWWKFYALSPQKPLTGSDITGQLDPRVRVDRAVQTFHGVLFLLEQFAMER